MGIIEGADGEILSVTRPETAWQRIKDQASPPNAKRFGAKVPCVQAGECSDCDSPNRICNIYLRIHRVWEKKRFHVIFVDDENLGF